MRASRFLPNNDFARCNCIIQGGKGEKKHCIVILMEQSASLPAVMSISGKTRIFLNPQRPWLKEHFHHQATGGAALSFRSVVMEMQLFKFQAKFLFFSSSALDLFVLFFLQTSCERRVGETAASKGTHSSCFIKVLRGVIFWKKEHVEWFEDKCQFVLKLAPYAHLGGDKSN